jgi:hypothetical protein
VLFLDKSAFGQQKCFFCKKVLLGIRSPFATKKCFFWIKVLLADKSTFGRQKYFCIKKALFLALIEVRAAYYKKKHFFF